MDYCNYWSTPLSKEKKNVVSMPMYIIRKEKGGNYYPLKPQFCLERELFFYSPCTVQWSIRYNGVAKGGDWRTRNAQEAQKQNFSAWLRYGIKNTQKTQQKTGKNPKHSATLECTNVPDHKECLLLSNFDRLHCCSTEKSEGIKNQGAEPRMNRNQFGFFLIANTR